MQRLPVNIENDGIQLWYGTKDAPAPGGIIPIPKVGTVEIIVGVKPVNTNNRVEVSYSINEGKPLTVKATFYPKVEMQDAQYFRAFFQGVKPGDTVMYFVRCYNKQGTVPPNGKEQMVTFSVPFKGAIKPQADQPIRSILIDNTSELPEEKQTSTIPAIQEQEKIPQKEQQLPPAKPEEEDPCPPKPLPEENLPAEREFWVTGTVTLAGKPMPCVRVYAYDKDMRSEQFLGDAQTDEAGKYLIQYSDTQFRRADKKSADLKLRAYYEDEYSAESNVIFNVDIKHQVDLALEPIEREPATEVTKIVLTEYEQYLSDLEPLMEGVPFQELTSDDMQFLVKETTIEKQHLEFLKWSFQIGSISSIPEAAFYGWYRRSIQFKELRDLLGYRITRLIKELEIAIGDHIIPELDLTEIKELLRSLRFEEGVIVRYVFEAQLIEQKRKLPLDDFVITAYDNEVEEPDDRTIGETSSDAKGMFSFMLSIPADKTEGYLKKVSLEIKNEEGELALDKELEVDPSKQMVHQIEVDLDALPDNSTVIDEKMASYTLLQHLKKVGISTIKEARKSPELINKLQEEFPDNPQVSNIVSHVNWSILLDRHEERQKLIDKGFSSIYDVTTTSKSSFIAKMGDELGKVQAAEMYLKAELVKWRVNDKVTDVLLKHANGKPPNETVDLDAIKYKEIVLIDNHCTCKDCESAVSPMAYLADLLKWIVKNIKWGIIDDVPVSELESTFYQPFGSLPVSCDAMNKEYRQVRICMDILRRFLRKNTESIDTTVGRRSAFLNAHSDYNRNVYEFLLNRMGLSFEELQSKLVPVEAFSEEDHNKLEYKSLAERAGIGVENLQDLYIPNIYVLHDQLFEIFGYFRLNDPFQENEAPRLLEWQFKQLKKIWASQDRSFAPYGFDRTIPIIDPTIITSEHFRHIDDLEGTATIIGIISTPKSSRIAYKLFEQRQEILTSYHSDLLSQIESLGLETVISNALGSISFPTLNELSAQINHSIEAAGALEVLANLGIPVEHFRRLMELVLADRPSVHLIEIANILTYVYKDKLLPKWASQEKALVELNGVVRPRVLQDSITFLIPENRIVPTSWLARPEDIEAWNAAYYKFNSAPLIDPDQLDISDFKIDLKSENENAALEIWESRLQWRERRSEAIQEAITSVELPSEKLSGAFSKSTTGISSTEIEELNMQLVSGNDISNRLKQLRISNDMFRFLIELHTSASADREVSNNQWKELTSIIVQIEKSHLFGRWKFEEHHRNIVLSDEFFVVDTIPSKENNPWLKDESAYYKWQSILEARIEQKKAQRDSLKSSLEAAEEQFLPQLREAYFKEIADIPGMPAEARNHSWFQSRLLINMQLSGCQKTTRVSEAILALQNFVSGIHNGNGNRIKVEEGRKNFDYGIMSENFEEEWKWLGSYANWRSAMFVHYYPENICQPQLQRHDFQSHGFKRLKTKINRNLTPERACELIKGYGAFFDDVKRLRVQATCYARTIVEGSDGCYIKTPTAKYVFLFALAEDTGNIYWCNFRDNVTYDNLVWKPISKINDNERVVKIIAATPYPSNEKHIALFVKTIEGNKQKLKVIFYNLRSGKWYGKKGLGLPSDIANSFQVIVGQRQGNFNNKVPVVLLSQEEKLFFREFKLKSKSWGSQDWSVKFWFNSNRDNEYSITSLGAIFQLNNENGRGFNHVLICQFTTKENQNEILSCFMGLGRGWRTLEENAQYLFSEIDKSASNSLKLYYKSSGKVKYKKFEILNPIIESKDVFSFTTLENSIWKATGLKFKDLPFDYSFTSSEITVHEDLIDRGELEKAYQKWINDGISCHFRGTLEEFLDYKTNDKLSYITNRIPAIKSWIYDSSYEVSTNDKEKLVENNLLYAKIIDIGITQLDSYYKSNSLSDSVKLKYQLVNSFLKNNTEGHDRSTIKHEWLKMAWEPTYWNLIAFSEIVFLGDVYYDLKTVIWSIKEGIEWNEKYLRNSYGQTPSFYWNGNLYYKVKLKSFHPLKPIHIGNKIFQIIFDDFIYFPKSALLPLINTYDTQFEGDYFIVETSDKEAHFANLTDENNKLNLIKQLSFFHYHDDIEPYLKLMKPYKEGINSYRIEEYYLSALKSSRSNWRLMQEAFRGVPELIALYLQKNGYYEESLNFFRKIFDYTKKGRARKKDYWLKYETSNDFESNFELNDDWWKDPLNPHRVASNRKGTYTRHIIQLIIRCLIEYADSEFSKDNVESNEKARHLYQQALELLKIEDLDFDPKGCGIYLDGLKTEVQKVPGMHAAFTAVNDPYRLSSLNKAILQANKKGVSKVQKIKIIKQAYQSSSPEKKDTKQLHDIVKSDTQKYKKLERFVFKDIYNQRALQKVSQKRANYYKAELVSIVNYTIYKPDDANKTLSHLNITEDTQGKTDTYAIIENHIDPKDIDGSHKLENTYVEDREEGSSFRIGQSFEFCMPPNPVLKSLYNAAKNNLDKLNNCMNIAGMKRDLAPYAAPTDTETGMPFIGSGGQLISQSRFYINQKPTQYRYLILVERAKQLAQLANQVEQALLSTLINLDQATYTLLKARQEMEIAEAGIKLQSLRVAEAESGVGLARLQKGQSQAKAGHFKGLIAQGLLNSEKKALSQMAHARNLQHAASVNYYASAAYNQLAATANFLTARFGKAKENQAKALSAMASGLSLTASATSTNASILSTRASYERRAQEWQLQKNLAEWDINIGGQQITIAQQRVGIIQQEKVIAELQLSHAKETVQFLANKFTNEDLYEWMSRVLQEVYIYYLQQATITAKLAESQLAFERQEYPPAIIQSDYRNLPLNKSNGGGEDDKYGLTGSYRLLRDITELDQYAFLNDTRKQLTVKTFSLAQLFPIEFQGLREDGVIVFSFNQEMFDRDFPGQYLRLIKRIRVSVVALISPNEGIKATLINPGISRTVIKGDTFQSTVIRRDPEVLALSGSPIENTGFFELQPETSMYLPFENSGVVTSFELRLPRPSNHFDFDSLADVLITVEYNALFDFNYRQQVTQRLGRDFGAERSFSFQYDFSDQWYDLLNPEYSDTPMRVRFQTRREFFPSNLSNIRIQHIALYFVLQDEAPPVEVTHFSFQEDSSVMPLGGSASSIDGLISTRAGNANSWIPILGLSPFGEWELNLSQLEEDEIDSPEEIELRRRFREGEIEDILFVISYEGLLPPWE